jgi:hypothetical protein
MQVVGLDVPSVWIRYFSLTGNADEVDVDAYLHGLTCLPPLDRNLVSHAVNELIAETPPPAAPYTHTQTDTHTDTHTDGHTGDVTNNPTHNDDA